MAGPAPSEAPLQYQTYEEALVVRSPSRSVYRDIYGAAFDSALQPIKESLLTRSWTPPEISYPPDIEELDLAGVEVVEEPHIYGGYFFDHFGHFLLESLARAWVVEEVGDLPFVWAAGDPPNAWQSEVLSMLGLTMSHCFPQRPTRFRRLVIAEPGYRIQTFFHSRHARFLGRWVSTDQACDLPAKVWLSRTEVSDSRRRSSGEEALQSILAARGWHIFHSQHASVDEQLRTMAGADVVAGLEGSAFHSAVLLKQPTCRFVVLRRGTSPNYRTIADRKGITEYDLYGVQRTRDRGDWSLVQAKRWAEIVDGLAQRIEKARGEPSRLEALRVEVESRYDYESWDRQQAWRWTVPRAKALTRRVIARLRRAIRST